MATTSSNKMKSPFLVNYRSQLRKERMMFILMLVLDCIGIPLMSCDLCTVDLYIPNWNVLEMMGILFSIAFVLLPVSLVLTAYCAWKFFSYLVNKSDTDMVYSLPISNMQRFFSNYLAGLVIWLVPLLISFVVGCSVLVIADIPWPLEFSIPYLAGFWLLTCLWVYNLTILCMHGCGKRISAFVSMVVLSVGTFFAVLTSIAGGAYSFEMRGIAQEYICAFGGPFYVFIDFFIGFQDNLCCLLISVLLMFAATLLMARKRTSESVSEAFPIRWFYRIIQFVTALAAMCFGGRSLYGCGADMIEIPREGIIVAFLSLVILGLICVPNLKKIGKRILGCVVVVLLTAAYFIFLGYGYRNWWEKLFTDIYGADSIWFETEGMLFTTDDRFVIVDIADYLKNHSGRYSQQYDAAAHVTLHYIDRKGEEITQRDYSLNLTEQDAWKKYMSRWDLKAQNKKNVERMEDLYFHCIVQHEQLQLSHIDGDALQQALLQDLETVNWNDYLYKKERCKWVVYANTAYERKNVRSWSDLYFVPYEIWLTDDFVNTLAMVEQNAAEGEMIHCGITL